MAQNIYLQSKPRYEILDGLRGVAALMVIIFHCFETYSWKSGIQIIDHGYLAVDFFFILSGFVVGYAYDDRWDRMSVTSFFKRRLVRLHPMVIMGTIVGVCLFLLRECEMFRVTEADGWTFLIAFLMCLFLIPCTPSMGANGLHTWDEFNPFNGPSWSLTFEYIANILYALVLRHLPKIAIALLCIVSAFFTLDLTLGWNLLGLSAIEPFSVIGGWQLSGQSIYIGFTRLAFPFLCGYLISRFAGDGKSFISRSVSGGKVRGGFWWCSLILIIILSFPRINGERCVADGLYQSIGILLVFPIIITLGASSRLTDPRSAKICKWLGDISYPLYITHYPLMYCQMAWVLNHPNAQPWQHIVLNIGVVLISVGIAWGCFKLYDEPVRRWLTDHWLKRKQNNKRGNLLSKSSI